MTREAWRYDCRKGMHLETISASTSCHLVCMPCSDSKELRKSQVARKRAGSERSGFGVYHSRKL